ncbi:MAG: DNA helicase [Oscillospiraceae bacterium]
MDKTKLRVTDIITSKDIEEWQSNDVITISAGTGRGKSYFVKNELYKYAKADNKKILMLLHRENCVKQFRREIEKDGKQSTIHVKTYQSLEYDLLHNKPVNLTQYKYICSDEFHYFLDDANFNKTTDVSFNKILDSTFSIRIFMSATGEDMKKYINNIKKVDTKNYEIPLEFSFIRSLTFFHKDDSMAEFIREAIANGNKAIFFIQKASKAYKLYKQFKEHCLFNCSKYNREYYKYVDKAKIDKMLDNEMFDEQILITTSCFDAGANIVDKNLKHIVVDIVDINSLIQCIGRKRIDYNDPNDKINLYVKAINNQQLGGFESTTKRKLEMAEYLMHHTTQELVDKYKRSIDYSGIIYDEVKADSDNLDMCTKKVNQLMYLKKKLDIMDYQTMKEWGEFGYCKKLAYLFGFYDSDSRTFTYRTIGEDYALESYLENNLGNILFQRKDRKEIIEKIDVRSNGRLLKSISALNSALKERKIMYMIVEFSTSTTIDGKQKRYSNAWKIVKL